MASFWILIFIVFNELFDQSNCSSAKSISGSVTLQYAFHIVPSSTEIPHLDDFLSNIHSLSFLDSENEKTGIRRIICDEKEWQEIRRFLTDRNISHSHSICCSKDEHLPSRSIVDQYPQDAVVSNMLDKLKMTTGLKYLFKKTETMNDVKREEIKSQKNDSSLTNDNDVSRILKSRSARAVTDNRRLNKKVAGKTKMPDMSLSSNKKVLKKSTVPKNAISRNKAKNIRGKKKFSKSESIDKKDNKKPLNIFGRTSSAKKKVNKNPIKKINKRNALVESDSNVQLSDKEISVSDDVKKLNEGQEINLNGSDRSINLLAEKQPKNEKSRIDTDDSITDYDLYGHGNNAEKELFHKLADCMFKLFEWLWNFGNDEHKKG